RADALLFGRVTYEMMEAAFRPPARTGARPDWMEPFARTIDAAKKYVVSSTLARVDWNAELVRGDLRSAGQRLKRESGKALAAMILLLKSGVGMAGFIEGVDRGQLSLLPESLDQWVAESNPVRVIDAFVEQLDLDELGFKLAAPAELGRPGYNPALHLKLYVHGYLNRIQSSRRLERECQRNLEVMWLLGRLAPDHKTIADFRKDNGAAIKKVCARFVEFCRQMGLLAKVSLAIDGSKFKAVNNRTRISPRRRSRNGAGNWRRAWRVISPSSTPRICMS